ncbi:hypothetical protein AAIB48_02165 [Paraclostridium benzoelyticum]
MNKLTFYIMKLREDLGMKAALWYGKRDVRVEDIKEPKATKIM